MIEGKITKINVTIINDKDGEAWPAEVVVDQPVGLWIDQILKGLDLPRQKGNQNFYYQLVIEESGKIIREDQILQSAGVREGDILRLERDRDFSPLPAAKSKTKPKTIPWKLITYIASLMVTIIGVLLRITNNEQNQKSDMGSVETTQISSVYPSLSPTEMLSTNTPISYTDSVQATPEPNINMPETWPVIEYDPFSQESENWIQGERELDKVSLNLNIKNGVYQIEANAHDNLTLYLVNSLEFPQDVFYSADVNLVETPPNEDFGLVFRQTDGSNYGGFGISNDGKLIAYFKIENKWFKPIDWKPSSAIKLNSINTLSVLIEGDFYRYYINGALVGQTTESRLNGPNYGFGFQLREEETAVVEFDNFQIQSLAN